MVAFVPVHAAHSIDQAVASIGLVEPLTGDEWLTLLRSAIHCADTLGLKRFAEAMAGGMSAQIPEYGTRLPPSITLTVQSNGAVFQRVSADGQILLALTLSRSDVRIQTHSYVRWDGFLEFISDCVDMMIEAYPSTARVGQIRLEYFDRFVANDLSAGPNWTDVVSPGSVVPSYPTTQPQAWHSHCGWFETDQTGSRRLVNINVDTSYQPTVEGLQQTVALYSLINTMDPFGANTPVTADIIGAFATLHVRSKEVIAMALTDSMQKRISLNVQGVGQ